ncbi:FMN-dependent alpha-hydroxy acid dehydrogenase [Multifurca ochricompacta]|uniref:FMN-dependent alpha-hydroxy acid dehydrogenase n=1 Tax=Multifurca ochricompacta TaxID=376703 RepID=A0AAD4M0X8_9AGAM|nr:FMN-dependent alpha-hydroxy acid dehydrogenase [Multifurca ochricompacta]
MTGDPLAPQTTWSRYLTQIYMTGQRPLIGSYDHRNVEAKAREATKDNHAAYMYTFGNAGTGSTYRNNLEALEQWRIIPRMLRNATHRNLDTTIFGVKLPSPVLLAPVGVQGILHRDGELATASAAARVGVPFIMSTASTRPIEAVAKASGDGHRWYQLYWPRNNDVTLSILSRAKAAGFTTLVLTLDTFLLGWRPHDLDTAYLPFAAGVGVQVGTSDPVFMKRMGIPLRPDDRPVFPLDMDAFRMRLAAGDEEAQTAFKLGAGWLAEANSGLFRSWQDLEFLRNNWDGPIVLKGVQTVEDAHAAMDARMDGIVVSNHGARQVDGAIGSFTALEKLRRKFTVLFDSGIRKGSDVIKAIAMGAQGVLGRHTHLNESHRRNTWLMMMMMMPVGRPFMYGLALGGEQGVEEVLRGLLADTEVTLGLSGEAVLEKADAPRRDVKL